MVYNVAYSPILNPIERVFSMVKTRFKSYRIQTIYEKREATAVQVLHRVMSEINQQAIKNLCADGIKRWQQDSYKLATQNPVQT